MLTSHPVFELQRQQAAQPQARSQSQTNTAAGAAAALGPYLAQVVPDLEAFLARCQALFNERSLPFHAPWWLRAWYGSFGRKPGVTPLWVAVQHSDNLRDALLLPLVCTRRWGVSVVEFADDGVVDYVAPLMAADWHRGLPPLVAAKALWQALRRALRNFDVWQVHKLLPQTMVEAGGQDNPLALVMHTQPCEMFGNVFSVNADPDTDADASQAASTQWEAWRRTLDKRTRKEIERCWRVFHRSPLARFEHATDTAQALALFETLEQQQSERMRALHTPYRLDEPECQAFYRKAIEGGLAPGAGAARVVLTALCDGEHVVSVLFGLTNGHRYLGLRQSLGGDAWKACSPARLLDEQTARHLHAQGREHFDFGIGDYHHKQALNMQAIALLDACAALSWRGLPWLLAWQLKHMLKRQAWAVGLQQRLRQWRQQPHA